MFAHRATSTKNTDWFIKRNNMSTTDIKQRKSEKDSHTRAMVNKYAGAWKDDHTSDEIISEIYSSRSSKSVMDFTL